MFVVRFIVFLLRCAKFLLGTGVCLLFVALCCSVCDARATIATNQLDTADTLHENEFDLTLSGFLHSGSDFRDSATSLILNYGLNDRITASVLVFNKRPDFFIPSYRDISNGDKYQLNIKYRMRREKLRSPGCAIGINGLLLDNPEVYIVFTKHATNLIGLHCGVKLNTYGFQDAPRPFAAVEINPLPNKLRLTVDYQWNFQGVKTGTLGLGGYYSTGDNTEFGIKWFNIDSFRSVGDNSLDIPAFETSGILAIQYLYRF